MTAEIAGRVFLLAITGKSGAGKSALAERVMERLAHRRPVIFSLDAYYRDLSHLNPEERARVDFDDPAALDWPLLVDHLSQLKLGRSIERPIYLFTSHTRSDRVDTVEPASLIVIEGLFAFDARIRHLLDFMVFVDASDETAFSRRLTRDVRDRGRSEESVIRQYREQVIPAFKRFIAPARRLAHLVVDGEGPLETSTAAVLSLMARNSNSR